MPLVGRTDHKCHCSRLVRIPALRSPVHRRACRIPVPSRQTHRGTCRMSRRTRPSHTASLCTKAGKSQGMYRSDRSFLEDMYRTARHNHRARTVFPHSWAGNHSRRNPGIPVHRGCPRKPGSRMDPWHRRTARTNSHHNRATGSQRNRWSTGHNPSGMCCTSLHPGSRRHRCHRQPLLVHTIP